MRAKSLSLAAAALFPRQPESIVAVTGTSGKTSVADFTRQIFSFCGFAAASLGTIGVVKPARRGLWLADDAGPGHPAQDP